MQDPTPCAKCRRPVAPGEAAVCLRALAAVLCYACRNVDSPDFEGEAAREPVTPADQVNHAMYRQWRALAVGPIGPKGFSESGAGQRARRPGSHLITV